MLGNSHILHLTPYGHMTATSPDLTPHGNLPRNCIDPVEAPDQGKAPSLCCVFLQGLVIGLLIFWFCRRTRQKKGVCQETACWVNLLFRGRKYRQKGCGAHQDTRLNNLSGSIYFQASATLFCWSWLLKPPSCSGGDPQADSGTRGLGSQIR